MIDVVSISWRFAFSTIVRARGAKKECAVTCAVRSRSVLRCADLCRSLPALRALIAIAKNRSRTWRLTLSIAPHVPKPIDENGRALAPSDAGGDDSPGGGGGEVANTTTIQRNPPRAARSGTLPLALSWTNVVR